MSENPKLFDNEVAINLESGRVLHVKGPFTDITLRDLFAMATPGPELNLTRQPIPVAPGSPSIDRFETDYEAAARARYEFADAMLRERAKARP